jgi:glucoamylase
VEVCGRNILTAEKGGIWLALGATDLNDNKKMDWEFDEALDGNIALTGELDLDSGWKFTTGVAFGDSLSSAVTSLFQSLATPFHQAGRALRRAMEQALQAYTAAGDDVARWRPSIPR